MLLAIATYVPLYFFIKQYIIIIVDITPITAATTVTTIVIIVILSSLLSSDFLIGTSK